MIIKYNPHEKPNAEEWLAMDDAEKVVLVEKYHNEKGIEIEGMHMHCLIHVVIENQLAMRIPEVLSCYRKLRQKNVTRHNALHALGNALSVLFYDIMKGNEIEESANKDYHKRLKKIRPSEWKK